MKNKYAKALKVGGVIIIILGTLLALIFAGIKEFNGISPNYSYMMYSPLIAIVGTFVSVFAGILFLGLGELVELTAGIYNLNSESFIRGIQKNKE